MFPESYSDGRDTFLSRVAASNGAVSSTVHPLTGPNGETLAVDVGTWNPESTNVLVVTSGTHGIEGFAGSGIQSTLLAEGLASRLGDARLVMIHAVNPHGFAWLRRVNEDNVDLNRNFIDHDAPHPRNEHFAVIKDLVTPSEWGPDTGASIAQALLSIAAERGYDWVQAAVTGGQYDYPDSVFYGGRAPTWSNRTIRGIAEQHLSTAERVLVIDIHTGLGDYGEAECIVEYAPDDPRLEIARSVWGERIRSTMSGDSLSADVAGSMISALGRQIGPGLVGIGLEYGTVPAPNVIGALIADQWLHNHGDPATDLGGEIKAAVRNAFYPDDDAWQAAVMDIARDVVDSALGLFDT